MRFANFAGNFLPGCPVRSEIALDAQELLRKNFRTDVRSICMYEYNAVFVMPLDVNIMAYPTKQFIERHDIFCSWVSYNSAHLGRIFPTY